MKTRELIARFRVSMAYECVVCSMNQKWILCASAVCHFQWHVPNLLNSAELNSFVFSLAHSDGLGLPVSMDILKKKIIDIFFENYCDVMNMNKHLNCAKWIIKHDAVCIINIISSFWKMIPYNDNDLFALLLIIELIRKKYNIFACHRFFSKKFSKQEKNCNCESTWRRATAISFLKWFYQRQFFVIFSYCLSLIYYFSKYISSAFLKNKMRKKNTKTRATGITIITLNRFLSHSKQTPIKCYKLTNVLFMATL